MFFAIFLFIVGLGILILGAEGLVRGAASAAKKLGVSSLVVGLTVVAFGTSMPELTVNMFSAWRGSADIAIGNIVGSNIANIFLILGICGLIRVLQVRQSTVWKEIPFALLAMALIFIMGNDSLLENVGFNRLSRTDGLALMSIFFIFLFYTFSLVKEGPAEEKKTREYSRLLSTLMIVGGLVFLFYGGKILVESAIILARLAGLSEAFIGLTIVAVGTSLPELVTSVVAVIHGHDDIAIGNIVGSNIFNAFWILGLTATILTLPFNVAVNFDILVGLAATLLLFLFMFVHHRHRLDRWQGGMFVLLYVGYIAYLAIRG